LFEQAQKSGRLGEIPTNHNPRFAPVIDPTLETGVDALMVAARAWLAA
jgi:hippurate hydrolase